MPRPPPQDALAEKKAPPAKKKNIFEQIGSTLFAPTATFLARVTGKSTRQPLSMDGSRAMTQSGRERIWERGEGEGQHPAHRGGYAWWHSSGSSRWQ